MNRCIGVLVIHGMGSQRPGFSTELIASVVSRLGDRAERLIWQEVHWADALEEREHELLSAMDAALTPDGYPVELRWRRTRAFVVHNFGDAIAYHRDSSDGSAYRLIHRLVSSSISALNAELGDPAAPVVVVAHSLGGHIMSNYIWDRQRHTEPDEFEPVPMLTSVISFGCSIPLFSLSFDIARPILLPAPGVAEPLISAARWINLLDPDDVLAWPLRPLYARHMHALSPDQRRTIERMEDRVIDAGGLLTAWNPASHTAYDSDDDLADVAADHLQDLLDALDADVGPGTRPVIDPV